MFDPELYLEQMLPALLERAEAKDLILRYALEPDTDAVPDVGRLDEVAALWRDHADPGDDKTLALFVSQHGGIVAKTRSEGRTFWKARWKEHTKAARSSSPADRLLRTMVQEVRATSRFVSTDQIEQWVVACEGAFDAERITSVAVQAGLQVCDPLPMPVGSGLVGSDADLMVRSLEVLRASTFLPVLFPGATLDELILRTDLREGPRLRWPMAPSAAAGTVPCAGGSSGGPEVLATAHRHWSAQTPGAPGTEAAQAVLEVLDRVRAERGDAGIDELLWNQAVALGRSVLRKGVTGHAALAQRLGELPMAKEGAELLAYSLLEASSGGSVELTEVRDALEADDVRLADQRLTPFLGSGATAEVTELRAEIQARLGRHATLVEQARALADSEPERAGQLLDEARSIVRDDPHPAELLSRLAAPAVPSVTATAGLDGITVTWEPSPILFGAVTYRVVRGDRRAAVDDPAAEVVCSDTSEHRIVDLAPVGHEVHYGVIAQRAGGRPSALTVTTAPATFLREVGDLTARVKGSDVHLSWSWPPGAKAVRASRSTRGAETVELAGAAAHGVVDTTTRFGFEYTYLVSVCFDDHGESVWSPGERVQAEVVPMPGPVSDLSASLEAEGFRLAWTRPSLGEVGIRRLAAAPDVRLGQEIDSGRLMDHGLRIDGEAIATGDRQEIVDRPPAGRWWYLPVTINGSLCVAGSSVPVSFVEPAASLTAKRRGDKVHVAWSWPEGSTDAFVEITSGGAVVHSLELTEAEYRRANGVWREVGPAPIGVSVVVTTALDSGRQRSAPATATVSGSSITVGQKLRRRLVGAPALELSTVAPTFVPAFVIRYVEGTVGPVDRDDGLELCRVDGFALPANGAHRVPLVGLPANTAVACFPQDPAMDDHVRFVNPLTR